MLLDCKTFFIALPLFAAISLGCSHKEAEAEGESETEARTPVTVTSASYDPIEEFIELNATSAFLQKSFVKSNLTGYIKSVNGRYGTFIKAGQPLFTLKTKESEALGNTINKLDPSFRFSGVNTVRAGNSGYITELDHQPGDYVQEGDQLAVISDMKSFVFVM